MKYGLERMNSRINSLNEGKIIRVVEHDDEQDRIVWNYLAEFGGNMQENMHDFWLKNGPGVYVDRQGTLYVK